MLKNILNNKNKLPLIFLLAIISFLSFNVLNKNFFKNLRFDLTRYNVYTLSDGTKSILKSIKEPLDFKLFYTKQIGDLNPVYQIYYDRVKEILEQYVLLSNNKIKLKILNPKPFSDEEDKAVEYGLQGAEIMAGVYGYFGLIATNSTDDEEKIIFFQPDRSPFLEYDLSKIVTNLANPNRRIVGLYTDLPMLGTFNPLAKSETAATAPPWAVYTQMKEFFEIKRIHEKTRSIPDDLELLMLVHPKKIPDRLIYMIDQFVLRGGKLLVFIDPNSETESFSPDADQINGSNSSYLSELLEKWGVELAKNKVVGDLLSARRVEIGASDQPSVTDYLAWLDIKKDHMDDTHQATSKVQRLTFATSGFLKNNKKNNKINFKRLVWSTTQSMQIDVSEVISPDPTTLLRNFVPSNEELTLVAEIKGSFLTNFPDGPPVTNRKDDFDKNKHINESIKPTTLVVLADADMLYDEYWLKYEQSGEVLPIANNADFTVNLLEYLNGTEDLIGLRGKGVSSVPFIKVEKIQKEAEQKFRSKEQELLEKLNNYQSKLENIQKGSGEDEENTLLTKEENLEIDKFREEMIFVRSELRKVQNALRKDIEKLDSTLKFFNIFLVPILLVIISVVLGFIERRKRHQKYIVRETN